MRVVLQLIFQVYHFFMYVSDQRSVLSQEFFRTSSELLQCRPLPIDPVHVDDRLAVSGSDAGAARELDELEADNGDFMSRALIIQVSCLKPSQNSSRLSFPSLSWKRRIWRIIFYINKIFFWSCSTTNRGYMDPKL